MPPCVSATATAGTMALNSTRGAHPTVRLDSYLRSTDAVFQNAEAPQAGDRFVRQMATYGQIRPSPHFISEGRVRRPFNKDSATDMSELPAIFHDPRGTNPKAGTLVIPQPSSKPLSTEFVDMYKNDKLLLPSERREEARRIIASEKQWREDRKKLFGYKKAIRSLEVNHPDGVEGVDGPMYPETRLYAERRAQLQAKAERRQRHAEGRFAHLAEQGTAEDAAAFRNYGADPMMRRSEDICAQRKCVDPEIHPVRFLDTHSRIFPVYTSTWDPVRAAALRSHDVRDGRRNIISGADNSLTFHVAQEWGLPDSS